jgi:hypothetical protein
MPAPGLSDSMTTCEAKEKISGVLFVLTLQNMSLSNLSLVILHYPEVLALTSVNNSLYVAFPDPNRTPFFLGCM